MSKQETKPSRTLVIGDIHGCLDALKTLEEFVGFCAADTIITLGDYIDRGPDSKGVIDWLIDRRGKYNLITLAGNHELMMEDAKHGLTPHYFWTVNGGDSTLVSFDCGIEDVPDKYWDFIDCCDLFYETDTHIFVHAGLEPTTPPQEQEPDTLCWLRFGKLKPHSSNKVIVCGHTPQRTHVPTSLPHAICIDTHAFHPHGYLTCLDVSTGDYWQANNQGITRKNTLKETTAKP